MFDSFDKNWLKFVGNESFIKKNKCFNAYILKLPLLEEHSLFGENTTELYFSKGILEKHNMIDKRTLKEVNEKFDENSQMNPTEYNNKIDLKYYKLDATTNSKYSFAKHCETLDDKEFKNFQEIFSCIENIISDSSSTK